MAGNFSKQQQDWSTQEFMDQCAHAEKRAAAFRVAAIKKEVGVPFEDVKAKLRADLDLVDKGRFHVEVARTAYAKEAPYYMRYISRGVRMLAETGAYSLDEAMDAGAVLFDRQRRTYDHNNPVIRWLEMKNELYHELRRNARRLPKPMMPPRIPPAMSPARVMPQGRAMPAMTSPVVQSIIVPARPMPPRLLPTRVMPPKMPPRMPPTIAPAIPPPMPPAIATMHQGIMRPVERFRETINIQDVQVFTAIGADKVILHFLKVDEGKVTSSKQERGNHIMHFGRPN